jgi:hypothetical protein
MLTLIIRVALYFLGLATAPKCAFYKNVVSAMTANPAFPTPLVPLADLTAQITVVEGKIAEEAAARTAWQTAKWQLQQEVDELDAMGVMQARYVGGVAQGDQAVIESSGYPITSARTPVGALPAPTNLIAVPGQTGAANVKCPTIRGAAVYVWEYAADPTGPWTEVYRGTRSRCSVPDLVPGAVAWFRVCVIGAAGQSDWSAPTNCRIA